MNDVSELKFEVTVPAAQIEKLIHNAITQELGFTGIFSGVKVKLKENFVPSQGSGPAGPKPSTPDEKVEDSKEKAKTMTDILKESMDEINKSSKETHKPHWTKQLEKSLLTKLIAFKCDCGHITWRLCKDGNFDCECNKCAKVHNWDVLELYRLDYSCKCGYKKYLYMPLSHHIKELKCGGCKAPIDITFNSKTKRFEQMK